MSVIVAAWALPIVIATITLDLFGWFAVIQSIRNGSYFGHFHFYGQPVDMIVQVVFLLLLALPIGLPIFWVYERVSAATKK